MMMQTVPRTGGWVEVVCGPMFSGKSEELLRRLTRAVIASQRVELVRPSSDTRHDDELVTHAGRRMTANRTSDLDWIRDLDVEVLGLDEIQFFPLGILDVVEEMAARGVRVVCSGLDMDYRRLP
jgi:thymidine kinase